MEVWLLELFGFSPFSGNVSGPVFSHQVFGVFFGLLLNCPSKFPPDPILHAIKSKGGGCNGVSIA